MYILAEHIQKYVLGQHLKTGWLTEKALTEFKLKMICLKK